ncbi:hypothetical protein BJ508DRAFT_374558 [Ascobolus immersus RN42]|uniref:Uncharacterized protein n=1 Tax=Ascobolus immersus RN42 TaxID=1160509 RepID=A0A3N4IDR7_ASCIM|nr:hypothetical protein BJ508DRAFT_374558 [Ascobolus immersus RN42]
MTRIDQQKDREGRTVPQLSGPVRLLLFRLFQTGMVEASRRNQPVSGVLRMLLRLVLRHQAAASGSRVARRAARDLPVPDHRRLFSELARRSKRNSRAKAILHQVDKSMGRGPYSNRMLGLNRQVVMMVAETFQRGLCVGKRVELFERRSRTMLRGSGANGMVGRRVYRGASEGVVVVVMCFVVGTL